MTVIAGVSLLDSVMLLSDSRIPIEYKHPLYCDIAQKIFLITPTTAIGFYGDVIFASYMLVEALKQLRTKLRENYHIDAISISRWLPRLFRRMILPRFCRHTYVTFLR